MSLVRLLCLFITHNYVCTSMAIGNNGTDVTNITIPAVLLSKVRAVSSIDAFGFHVLLTCRLWDYHY